MRIMLFAALLAASVVSIAQSAPTATISFAAPTKNTDGSAIAGTLTYNVYQAIKGGTKVKVGTITATSMTVTAGLAAGVEYCWDVTAVANGQESAHSNEGCKAFAFPVPNTVVITVT